MLHRIALALLISLGLTPVVFAQSSGAGTAPGITITYVISSEDVVGPCVPFAGDNGLEADVPSTWSGYGFTIGGTFEPGTGSPYSTVQGISVTYELTTGDFVQPTSVTCNLTNKTWSATFPGTVTDGLGTRNVLYNGQYAKNSFTVGLKQYYTSSGPYTVAAAAMTIVLA